MMTAKRTVPALLVAGALAAVVVGCDSEAPEAGGAAPPTAAADAYQEIVNLRLVGHVDVTNPAAPVYLAHLPPTGDEANGTQHVQVCDGRELRNGDPAKVYAIRTNGQIGYEVLDVTDPAKPAFLMTIAATGTSSRPKSDRGNRETHKFQWDCATGVAYMNGTAQDWRVTRVLQAFDVGDPKAPKHIRDFALTGYEPTAAGPFPEPQVAGLHQPFVVGKRMYLGYNSGDDG